MHPVSKGMKYLKLIYICSPLRGNIAENINKATQYCAYAAQQGVIPIAPHTMFTKFLDDTIPLQREKGLAMGIELLKRCDGLWVCGDTISQGMQNEINYAKQQNIPTKSISEVDITQQTLLEQETAALKEKIREIQRESPIFLTRNDEGIVTSVILPEESHDKLTPEEITKVEDYIIRASSKSFDPEPTQIEEQSPGFEMQE